MAHMGQFAYHMIKYNNNSIDITQKLKLTTKLAYGAGDLGPAITSSIFTFFTMVLQTIHPIDSFDFKNPSLSLQILY